LFALAFGYSFLKIKQQTKLKNKMRKRINIFLSLALLFHCVAYTQINFCGEVLPVSNNQVNKNFINVLQKVNRKCNPRVLYQRAQKYFPYVEEMLAKYGIPDDFKYLPLIETGFYNYGPNHVGAAGVWAIMPATAKMFYGLKIEPGYDERMDFEKATHFSLRLIRWLYDRLGSWTLVAAAYNGGIGRIERKVKLYGHKDFYRMSLCKETAEYVLKLVTFKELFTSELNIDRVMNKVDSMNSTELFEGQSYENNLIESIENNLMFEVDKNKITDLFNAKVFPQDEKPKYMLSGTVVGWVGQHITVKVNGRYYPAILSKENVRLIIGKEIFETVLQEVLKDGLVLRFTHKVDH
jgi:hypothetical protein